LSLASVTDKGCCFSIDLPRVAAVRKVEPVKAPHVELSGTTVLCVDDDEDVLAGMVEMLSTWDCEVLAADNVVSAEAMFEQHKFNIDIVLVDYQLSEKDNGIALVESLRTMTNVYLPAILISATTDEDIAEKTAAADIGYMRKMVKPAALRAMISAKLSDKLHRQYVGEQV
ncbi:MAG: hybrid sensor histidine kinase/response regulator, partial [Colwelliaceae bacterium]|nr:hybrid sensor histidine kinase/response regulator [Colwelliaceae bacterium]